MTIVPMAVCPNCGGAEQADDYERHPAHWVECRAGAARPLYFCSAACVPAQLRVNAPRHALAPLDITIIKLMAMGQSNGEIAHELDLGVSTVKNRLSRVFHALGVEDRVQLLLAAHQRGIVNVSLLCQDFEQRQQARRQRVHLDVLHAS